MVSREFATSFDGVKAQVGDIVLELSEEFVSRAIGFPMEGERWYKGKHLKNDEWKEFLTLANRQAKYKSGFPSRLLRKKWRAMLVFIIRCHSILEMEVDHIVSIWEFIFAKELLVEDAIYSQLVALLALYPIFGAGSWWRLMQIIPCRRITILELSSKLSSHLSRYSNPGVTNCHSFEPHLKQYRVICYYCIFV